ncbi:MAG: 16S rRNA (adenine(1518)-N(6)/adenine(1519)-N(6))-dimethyltransferase RsmA [Eggerthellaceae bacterium]|nr:16S rRNA (adenine(1518)-N(6)/adenine(1519)-N(6))-dimethyltransferase RsmA [Eggerthellaceae bacterium]
MADKLSFLTSVATTRAVLETYGLATKKALGQHFLISDGVVKRICDVAALHPQDKVLEVGPGIGTLTIALLQKAASVVAVERDSDLIAVLADTCAAYGENLTVLNQDALNLSETDLPFLPNKFVANLPYAVAATLVLDFFERFSSLESATVMVQSEVADRMCAKPSTKTYGSYTVKLSLFARPTDRFTVGAQNFFPPPRVDSAVLRLDRCRPQDAEGVSLSAEVVQATAMMADAAFANRRKTILNSCKSYFEARTQKAGASKDFKEFKGASSTSQPSLTETLEELFEQAGIDPKRRGETLSTADFIRLGLLAKRLNILNAR